MLYDNKLEINRSQLKISAIVRMALRNDDSELLLMPLKEKRIIKLDTHGLYIQLHKSTVEITNHKFNYYLELNFRLSNKLIKMFDAKLDARIQLDEFLRMNQIEIGLNNVLQSMIPQLTELK